MESLIALFVLANFVRGGKFCTRKNKSAEQSFWEKLAVVTVVAAAAAAVGAVIAVCGSYGSSSSSILFLKIDTS